jgi:hypothetical protein
MRTVDPKITPTVRSLIGGLPARRPLAQAADKETPELVTPTSKGPFPRAPHFREPEQPCSRRRQRKTALGARLDVCYHSDRGGHFPHVCWPGRSIILSSCRLPCLTTDLPMRRLALLPLCVCLSAPLWCGCQTSPRLASADRPQPPSSFLSAEGRPPRTELASGRTGTTPVRFVSRSGQDHNGSLTGLLSGSRTERIPLPRTDAMQTVDRTAAGNQPIGAF